MRRAVGSATHHAYIRTLSAYSRADTYTRNKAWRQIARGLICALSLPDHLAFFDTLAESAPSSLAPARAAHPRSLHALTGATARSTSPAHGGLRPADPRITCGAIRVRVMVVVQHAGAVYRRRGTPSVVVRRARDPALVLCAVCGADERLRRRCHRGRVSVWLRACRRGPGRFGALLGSWSGHLRARQGGLVRGCGNEH